MTPGAVCTGRSSPDAPQAPQDCPARPYLGIPNGSQA
jgi:hypothetical protein